MENFRPLGRAGEGAHGLVFKAIDKKTHRIVALKKICFNSNNPMPKNALREICALRVLQSPNIVELIDIRGVESSVVLVMEYLPCSLSDVMVFLEKPLDLSQIKTYMQMFLSGVSFMHGHNIMHRDLKPANLLISHSGVLKIADFGLARIYRKKDLRTYSHQVATRWYRAPELLYGSKTYTPKVDMWSVGCVLGEMIKRKPLFPGETDIEQLAIVLGTLGTPDEEVWPGVTSLPDYNKISFALSNPKDWNSVLPGTDENTLDLVSSLLQYNEHERPTAGETMINMAFCWLILIGRAIQKLVFGELRVSEQQHLKDKFWNFIFYKFIFIFGIINVQFIDEVLLWCSWFSLLGFLHLLSQLSNDRFEYLSFSPTTPVWNHVKLLFLLATIFALSGFMLLIAVFVGFFGGFNTFAFMSAEVILLSVRTLYIIIKYGLHLYDLRREDTATSSTSNEENKVWERRGPIVYYTELGFEMAGLVMDLIHHLHMLVWSNIFLSMASLVICMQLRYLFNEIQRRYKKHRNYLWVRSHLELNYPMASSKELAENLDKCAICWERMETARKLPCAHLFHDTCLLSWLEQDTSCPTCRMSLNIQSPSAARIESPRLQMDQPQPARRQLNHFFHFDGSRYVSWLPSFSVEVSHAQLIRQDVPASNSQLDAMARQVQQLFPSMPLSTIIDDLRITRSVELTIENVLDGRLVAPPIFREPQTTPISTQSNFEEMTVRSWDSYNMESTETDDTANLGRRFSKSSQERQITLQRRKDNLIHIARKKYIEKQKAALSENREKSS